MCAKSFVKKWLFTWLVWKRQKSVICVSYVSHKNFSFCGWKLKCKLFTKLYVIYMLCEMYACIFFQIFWTYFKRVLNVFSKNRCKCTRFTLFTLLYFAGGMRPIHPRQRENVFPYCQFACVTYTVLEIVRTRLVRTDRDLSYVFCESWIILFGPL